MKMVFDESGFDEIDHFHPNFDESAPNPARALEIHPRLLDKPHA